MTAAKLVVLALFLGPGPAGCAFEDGQSWARAKFAVETELDPDGRLSDGRYRTTKEYEVELDSVSLLVGAIAVSAGASGTIEFSPSNPPAGYSLCHNGHCHSDDGRLVDYEDIAAQIGGEASSTEVTATVNQSLDVVGGEQAAASCEGACELPRGAVTRASAVVRLVRLRGTAFDTRSDSPRLPSDGVAFDWEIPVETTLDAPLSREIGKDFGGDLEVATTLTVSAQLLDAIDFEEGLQESEFIEKFNEESLLKATITQGE
jgi:hypothetical protein